MGTTLLPSALNGIRDPRFKGIHEPGFYVTDMTSVKEILQLRKL